WPALLEKAYAQLSASGWNARPALNAYSSLDAGVAMNTLPVLTGGTASSAYVFGSSSSYISAISAGTLLTLATGSAGGPGIVSNHDYAVLGYNTANQTFTLLNPWGWNTSYGYPGILNLTWSQLQTYFSQDGNCLVGASPAISPVLSDTALAASSLAPKASD